MATFAATTDAALFPTRCRPSARQQSFGAPAPPAQGSLCAYPAQAGPKLAAGPAVGSSVAEQTPLQVVHARLTEVVQGCPLPLAGDLIDAVHQTQQVEAMVLAQHTVGRDTAETYTREHTWSTLPLLLCHLLRDGKHLLACAQQNHNDVPAIVANSALLDVGLRPAFQGSRLEALGLPGSWVT